jgi:hypothetical protein
MDFAFVLLTAVFFAASFWFLRVCDALDPAREVPAPREEKR